MPVKLKSKEKAFKKAMTSCHSGLLSEALPVLQEKGRTTRTNWWPPERTLQKVSDVCRTTIEIGKELNEERKRVAEEKLLPNSSWVQIKLYFQYSLLTQFLVVKFAVN